MSIKDQLNYDKLPAHVAIIMDGNGRWAKQKGNNRIYGHRNGVQAVREVVEAAGELKISYLTLYAFSTENWNRPRVEVEALMALLVSTIHSEIQKLHKNNVRLMTIGDQKSLPPKVQKELAAAIETTQHNTGLTLNLALSYSGRWDLSHAMQQMAADVAAGKITPAEINESTLSTYISTAGIPDPELLIRTSGEFRISNFLLWQLAYTELHFSQKFWPDFNKEDFYAALLDFQNRERRFGKISEQVSQQS